MRTATLTLALMLTACDGADLGLDQGQTLARQASDDDFTVPMNEIVLERLIYYQDTAYTEAALQARASYEPLIHSTLDARGLPHELEAVAFVESGFRNIPGDPAVRPGAGMWQFIPSTARTYGLRVDADVDERMVPEAATPAAAALLSDLYDRYHDWGLAFAGYNSGPERVDAAIHQHDTHDVFELMRQGALPPYAASVMAAVIVLKTSEPVDAQR